MGSGRFHGFVSLCGVLPSGLGTVRSTTTTAATRLSRGFHPIACFESPGDERVRHLGDDHDLPFVGIGGEQQHGGIRAGGSNRVHRREKRVFVRIFDSCHDRIAFRIGRNFAGRVDHGSAILRGRRFSYGLRGRPERFDPSAKAVAIDRRDGGGFEVPDQVVDRLRGVSGLHCGEFFIQFRCFKTGAASRLACQCRDSTDSCRESLLAEHDEVLGLGGIGQVRATAELDGLPQPT